MNFKLGKISLRRLEGVHPDLVRVVKRAIELTPIDFGVSEGVRTLAKQKEYVKTGASKTMRSRHLTGHAVDLVPLLDLDMDGDLDASWLLKHFQPIAVAMKAAAKELNVPIEWGYDLWQWDGPHFQLPRSHYA